MTPPEIPPRNPIYSWLRVLLWLVPAGYALIGGIGITLLARPLNLTEPVIITLWAVTCIAFTGAAGWCDHRLAAADSVSRSYHPWVYVIMFILGQLIGVPLVIGVVMIGFCAVIDR